jgi:hypothetical protein
MLASSRDYSTYRGKRATLCLMVMRASWMVRKWMVMVMVMMTMSEVERCQSWMYFYSRTSD